MSPASNSINNKGKEELIEEEEEMVEELEEEEEEDNNNNTCEKLIQSIKQALRVKSLRRGIGFCCIIWLVYHQQLNIQHLELVTKMLNMTDITFIDK